MRGSKTLQFPDFRLLEGQIQTFKPSVHLRGDVSFFFKYGDSFVKDSKMNLKSACRLGPPADKAPVQDQHQVKFEAVHTRESHSVILYILTSESKIYKNNIDKIIKKKNKTIFIFL